MANFPAFFCLVLVVSPVMMKQAYRLSADIDKMVEVANAVAAKYVAELEQQYDNFIGRAWTGVGGVSETIHRFAESVEDVLVDANGILVSECADLARPVISRNEEILVNIIHCVSKQVDEVEKDVALRSAHLNSELTIITHIQTYAQSCTDRLNKSQETPSDIAEASACIKPLYQSALRIAPQFESISDIRLAKDLFNDYEVRVDTCFNTAYSKLNSAPTAQDVFKDISNCVAKENEAS